jgi:hypothetical protein
MTAFRRALWKTLSLKPWRAAEMVSVANRLPSRLDVVAAVLEMGVRDGGNN